jgi:hypothetical protein
LIKNAIHTALFFLLLAGAGCYEPKAACLDLLAANYDVSADEACDDCCVYPSFTLGLSHQWESRNFILKDTFVNNVGDSVVVISQKFFLGSIELGNAEGLAVPFISKNTYKWSDGNTRELSRNFKLVSGTLTEISINTFREGGGISYLKFAAGPDALFNGVDTLSLTADSDLTTTAGMRTQNNNYLCYKATIIAGVGLKDTLDIGFEGQWNFQKSFNPALPITWGKVLKTQLKIKYDQWFKDVDLDGIDALVIGNAMKANTPLVFE